jgi:hypothetical protein
MTTAPMATADPDQSNLIAILTQFAAWRPCSLCRDLVLFVDEQAKTTSPFVCGRCGERQANLGKKYLPRRRFFGLISMRPAAHP